MVRLVRDKENRISVKVTATVDYTGFSAALSISGIDKGVANLKAKNIRMVFTTSEVAGIGKNAQGILTIYDSKGEVYVKNLVWFETVGTESDAVGYQTISVVLVSMKQQNSSYRPDSDWDKIIDEKIEKVMTESIDAKVEECVDKIIDEKVETAVEGIIDEKVTTVVDSVIDSKVEEAVNDLFDSSDSDTVGGVINALEDTVYDNILPRVSDIEEELSKKVSVKHEESDENMTFFTTCEDSDDSSGV